MPGAPQVRGSWIARFRNGPAERSGDHVFASGPIRDEIRLAPRSPDYPGQWTIVDGSGSGEVGTWPAEVRYRVAEVEPSDNPLAEVVAWYEVVYTHEKIVAIQESFAKMLRR